MPPSVTEIDAYAFWARANLKEVNIPETVKKIGNYAFRKNSELKTISFGGTTPTGVTPFLFTTYYSNLKLCILPEYLEDFGGLYQNWNNGMVIAQIDNYEDKYNNGSFSTEDSRIDADPHSIGLKNAVAHAFGISPSSKQLTATERKRLPKLAMETSNDNLTFQFVLPKLIPEDTELRVLYSEALSTPAATWEAVATKKANYGWTGTATITQSSEGADHTLVHISKQNSFSAKSSGFMRIDVSINP